MGKKRTKRKASAQPKPTSKTAPRLSMLELRSPFKTEPPPSQRVTLEPPASSPALDRAADAYSRPTIPVRNPLEAYDRTRQTTMLPPPLPEPADESTPPVSHERVKAVGPSAEDERPSDGTLDRLADAFTPSFLDYEEQRTSKRVSLEVELHVASDSHFFTGLSGDISEGGVFVSTYRSLPIGSEVDLEFTLPTSWQRVRARGRVRWLRTAAPPGVGIAFDEIDEIDRAAIERFCTTVPPLYYDDVG